MPVTPGCYLGNRTPLTMNAYLPESDPNIMSIQAALAFFQTVRHRPDLQQQIDALGPSMTATQLVELVNKLGFACSAAEVQEAFRYDWTMRWLHYAPTSPLE